MEKQLSENKMVAFNIASTAIIACLNFISTPIFTRMLDQAEYGIVTIYVSWVQIFTVLIGLEMRGSIGPARANLPEDEQDSYQFSTLLLSFCSFSLFLLGILLLNKMLAAAMELPPALIICIAIQSFGSFLVSFFNTRYIFQKRANKNFILSVSLSFSTLLLAVLFILAIPADSEKYMGWVLGFTIPNFAIGLFLFVRFGIKHRPHFEVSFWRFALLLSVPLMLHGLSSALLAQVGKLSVQHYFDDSLAAIYGIGVTAALLINAVYSALNNAFVPFMYDDLAGKTSEAIKRQHFMNYMVLFTLMMCAYLFASPEVVKVISPESYWSVIPVLPILIIGQYCVFLYSFPVNFELFSMKSKYVAVGTMSATAVNIVLALVLVPSCGMMGAAVATTVAYAALFVFHLLIARFLLHDRNYQIRYLFYGLGLVCACAIVTSLMLDIIIFRWAIVLGFIIIIGLRIVKKKTIF